MHCHRNRRRNRGGEPEPRGTPEAKLSIEESAPNLVNVLLAAHATPGLRYLDCLGRVVLW